MAEFSIRPDDPAQSVEEVWPPFGLRIESPRLVLRVLREADFPAYIAAATSGVTTTEKNPFRLPWNEEEPSELVRRSIPFLYSKRGEIGPSSWYLLLGVFLKEEPESRSQSSERGRSTSGSGQQSGVVRPGECLIGVQDCDAEDWPVLRTVSSGSWLRSDAQGQGYGKEMRAAMLLWAFDHFDADFAESGAYTWNERSRRVSESLGYFTAGTRRVPDAHGENAEWEYSFRLPKADFIRPPWNVKVSGSKRLKNFFTES